MQKNNQIIREALFKNNKPLYWLGSVLGKSEMTITRMMRTELPIAEQKQIAKLIRESVNKEASQ